MKYNFENNLLNVLGLSNNNRYEIEYIIEIIIEKKGWKNLNGDIIINDKFYNIIINDDRVKDKLKINLTKIYKASNDRLIKYETLKKIVNCFIRQNSISKNIDTGNKIKLLVI